MYWAYLFLVAIFKSHMYGGNFTMSLKNSVGMG